MSSQIRSATFWPAVNPSFGYRIYRDVESMIEENFSFLKAAEPSQKQCDDLALYLQRIGERELLTPEVEQELAHKVKDGDSEARTHLIEANLRLVVNIAKGYQGQGMSFEDLIEEGNLAVIRAVDGFEPGTYRFSTYATRGIHQSIHRALDEQRTPVRITPNTRKEMREWRKAQSLLPPGATETEIAEHITASRISHWEETVENYSSALKTGQLENESDAIWKRRKSTLEKKLASGQKHLTAKGLRELIITPAKASRITAALALEGKMLNRLDTIEFDNSEVSTETLLEDSDSATQLERLSMQEQKVFIEFIVSTKLSDNEQFVLQRRLPMPGFEQQTLDAIALELDLSRERIRQIAAKAKAKLSKAMARPQVQREFAGAQRKMGTNPEER